MTVVLLLAGVGICRTRASCSGEDEMIVRWIDNLPCRRSKHGALLHR